MKGKGYYNSKDNKVDIQYIPFVIQMLSCSMHGNDEMMPWGRNPDFFLWDAVCMLDLPAYGRSDLYLQNLFVPN